MVATVSECEKGVVASHSGVESIFHYLFQCGILVMSEYKCKGVQNLLHLSVLKIQKGYEFACRPIPQFTFNTSRSLILIFHDFNWWCSIWMCNELTSSCGIPFYQKHISVSFSHVNALWKRDQAKNSTRFQCRHHTQNKQIPANQLFIRWQCCYAAKKYFVQYQCINRVC